MTLSKSALPAWGLLVATLVVPAASQAADPPGSLALDWPMGFHDGNQLLPGYDVRVMQNFANSNPSYGNRQHSALDLAKNVGATIGATVYSAADGQVVCIPVVDYPGKVVVVEHTLSNGTKIYTQYGHLNSTLSVTNNQWVNRGTPLGTILSWPGNASNSHLHFEIRNFKDWTPGNCAGPGYADTGMTPLQQGWLDPIDQYYLRRPTYPGRVTTDIAQGVRNLPNRNGSSVIATVTPGLRMKTDGVFADQGGTDEWWSRANYSGSSWGYLAGYWDDGWGGEIFTTELTRYPGPQGFAEGVVSGTDLYGFARATNGEVRYRRRSSAGVWTAWTNLGGVATSEPAVVVPPDGRLVVFVRAIDNTLAYRRQASPGATSWGAWATLGGSLTSAPAVAANSDGRLQVFVRWTDGALWTRSQTSAGGSWGSWSSLGGVISYGPAVIRNTDGRLAVFVAGLDNDLFQIAQTTAGGAFGSFQSLGGVTTAHPTVVRNNDGKLELFVRGAAPNHELRHLKQTVAGGGWGAWQNRGGTLTAAPRVAVHTDGRLEVFVRGTSGALHNLWQTTPGGGWSSWGTLGGLLIGGPVAINQGGLLQVIVLGTPNTLYHLGQTGSGWSAFSSLGTSYGPF